MAPEKAIDLWTGYYLEYARDGLQVVRLWNVVLRMRDYGADLLFSP